MKNNYLIFCRLVFGLAIYISAIGGAQAVSLTLSSTNSPVTVGSQATFSLWMDFSGDPTLGGGVDVVFNNFTNGNQLSFASYTPNTALGDSFFYTTPHIPAINATGTSLEAITFGDIINGLEGPALVGTLVFNTLVAGTYNLSLVDSVSAGGFFSVTGSAAQFPTYTSASLTVNPSVAAAAPEPAIFWLMLAGLVGMAFRAKAKQGGRLA